MKLLHGQLSGVGNSHLAVHQFQTDLTKNMAAEARAEKQAIQIQSTYVPEVQEVSVQNMTERQGTAEVQRITITAGTASRFQLEFYGVKTG